MEKEIRNYLKILEASPDNVPAFDALVKIYQEAERWNDLAKLYIDKARRTTKPKRVPDLYFKAAEIYSERLGKNDLVEDCLKKVLAIDPLNERGLKELKARYRTSHEWDKLIALIEKEAENKSLPADKASCFSAIAELCDKELGDPACKIDYLERALAVCPDHPDALRALKAHYFQTFQTERALELVKREEALLADNPEALAGLSIDAGLALAEDPFERQRAMELLRAGIEKGKKNKGAAARLKELESLEEKWPEVTRKYQEGAVNASDKREASAIYAKVAGIYYLYAKDRTEDILGAIEKSLFLDPGNARALNLGERFLTEREAFGKLEMFWRDIFARTRDEALRVATMAKCAELLLTKLNKREAALALYRDLYQIDPDHEAAFEILCAELLAQNKHEELKKLYELRLKSGRSPKARAAALAGLAQMALASDNDTNKARKWLEEALDVCPGYLPAARTLLPLYDEGRQDDKLLAVLEIVARESGDPAERAAAYARAAKLHDEAGRKREAFTRYALGFRLAPEDAAVWTRLEELGLELECWEEFVELLKDVLSRAPLPEGWRKLAFRLGQINDRELSQYAEAEAAYRLLLNDGPDRDTLDALIRLYSKDLRWDALVEVLGVKAQIATDGEEKRDILLELARVVEEELHDKAGAVAAYENVLAVDPEELEALGRLEELHAQANDHAKLADVLERSLVAISSIPERIKVNLRLGDLCRDNLKENERAARAYLAALALDNANAQAIKKLEPMLGEGVMVGAIFRGLEAHYLAKKKFDKLAQGYEALIAAEDDPKERGLLCHKLADLFFKHLKKPEEAYGWILKGLALPGATRAFLDSAFAIAKANGKMDELSAALEARAESESDPVEATRFSVDLAGLLWERETDAQGASRHYLKAVGLAPADPQVLRAATAFFEQTDDFSAFANYGLSLARLAQEPKERHEVYSRVAEVVAKRLSDNARAQDIYREMLAGNEGDDVARDGLLALQEEAGQWSEAAATLTFKRERLARHDSVSAQGVALHLAEVLEKHLNDAPAAAAILGEILSENPAQPEALAMAERFFIEQLAEERICAVLKPIYEDKRDFAHLVQVLERQYGFAKDGEAFELAVRIAEIYEDELSRYDLALAFYGKAFLAQSGIALLRELSLAAEMAEDFESFVLIGEEKLGQELSNEERIDLLFALAQAAGGQLKDTAGAKGRYEAIVALDAANERAIDALIELARALNDPALLCQWLEAKRTTSGEKSVRREAALEVAELCFKSLNDAPRAVAVLMAQLEERENDPPVFARLDEILTATDDHAGLVALCERRLKFEREDAEILPLKIRIADLLEERLERHDEALALYVELARGYWNEAIVAAMVERLLTRESTELAIAREMEQKYIKSQDWPRLVNVYEIELRHCSDPAEKSKLLAKLSGIYQDKLKDNDKAFVGFARVFIDDPLNQAAQDELEKLASDLGSWKELAEVYEKAGEGTPDNELSVELFIKAARLYEDILAFQEEAIRAYRKVLGRDRNNMTAIQALEGLCRKTERWEELRDIYLQRIELSGDVGEKRELYANICILYEHQLEDPLGATPYYEAMLDLLPQDLDVVEKLAGLYVVSDNWSKLANLYGHKITLLDTERERNELRMEKARLHEEKLNEPQAAKDLYKTVLESDETHIEALVKLEYYVEDEQFQPELARFLTPVYRRAESYKRVIDMEEFQLVHSALLDERLDLYKDMAITYEEHLEQKTLAYGVLARAFKEEPTDEYVQGELERLARALGQLDHLCSLYEERIAALDPQENAQRLINLHQTVAVLYEQGLGEIERAAASYRAVLLLEATHLDALNNLERIYPLQKKWAALIDIFECKLPLMESLEERKSVLFKVCNIFEEELHDNRQAILTYHRILELDTQDSEVLRALVRLNTAESRWEALLEIRARQLELSTEPAAQHDLKQAMALVLWRELARTPEAIEIFAGILNEDPDYLPSREALEELLTLPETELAAARLLEPLYARDNRHADLIHTLEIEARHEETITTRRDLFLRMADLAERRTSDPARAFGFTLSALSDDPQNAQIREAGERLARATSGWYELAATYKARAQREADPAIAIDLYLTAGRVVLRECDDAPGAEPLYGAARAVDGHNATALDALEEIFGTLAKWPELVDVYYVKAELAPSAEAAIALYVKSAKVREEKLNDQSLAVESLLRALDRDANHGESLAELDRLYESLGRFEERAAILAKRGELARSVGDRLAFTFARGRVFEERLGRRLDALEVYRGILVEIDDYADALGALEAMVLDTALQDAALAVLTPLYERKAWWERLVGLLDAYLDTLTDHEKRLTVLSRIKSIDEDELRDAPRAFQVACRIYGEDLHDVISRQEMERLAVVTGGFEGLVATYRSFLDQVDELDLKTELLTKIARLCEEQLEDDTGAVEAWREVLRLSAEDSEALEAIQSLDRLLERLGRFEELVELLPRAIAQLSDPSAITDQRLRLAAIYEEKLGNLPVAVDVLNLIIREHSDHPAALAALERLYEALERWPELIETYKAQVRIARGDTKKAQLYAKMAHVYAEKLGERREAIPLWVRVLQFDEQNVEVMEKLEALYLAEGLWDELVNHYKKRQRLARSVSERAAITKSMAFLYRDRLGQEDRATQLFLKVLDYTPQDLSVIDALEAIYLNNQAWSDLGALLKRLVGQVTGGAEQRSLHLRLAAIELEHLDHPEEGERLARQVLDSDPTREELERLERLFANTDALDLYLDILARQAQASEDVGERTALYLRMAHLNMSRRHDTAAARAAYEQILGIVPNHLQAAEALEPLYRQAGEWTKLCEVLNIRLNEATGESEKSELLRQLADVYEERLNDPASAFLALTSVFRIEPGDEAILARLTRLAEALEAYGELASLLCEVIPAVGDKPRLARTLTYKVAGLYETQVKLPEQALAYYKLYLEGGEFDAHAVDYLIATYEASGEWQALIDAYHLKVPHMHQEEKVRVGCRVAEIFDIHLGQTKRAVKTYMQVLKMDEHYLPAIDALIGIHARNEEWELLAEVLRKKLHVVSEPQDVAELRLRIAELYHTMLNDTKQAKVYYRALLADDPRHLRALDELEHIYLSEENYDELLEILSRRVNVMETDAEHLAIYAKMASIWEEKFGQRDMAVTYYEKMLALAPDSLPAITNLERIYRESGDYAQLAATYQRHIDQCIEPDEIVRLYTEMGRLYGEFLATPEKAIEFFTRALTIDEGNYGVLSSLADLYLAGERYEEAIDTLNRLSVAAKDKAQRVEALARLGRLYHEKLGDAKKAKEVYDRMLAEDPSFVPALQALRRYYSAAGDWQQFLKIVEEEKRHSKNPADRAEVTYEEGRYYHEQAGDVERALALYREALTYKDDLAPLLRVLSGICFERGALAEAKPLIEKLLTLPETQDAESTARAHYRLAFIAEREENDAETLKHYMEAYKLDSNHLPTLEGLARALYKREEWDRAFRVYQTILVRFRDQKSVAELVEVFCRLGDVNGKLGKHDIAVRMYEKALELDPESERALLAIVFYYESLGNFKKVLLYRARLIKIVSGEALFEQWRAVGDIYAETLNEPEKGLEAYRNALEVKSDDVPLLTKVAGYLLDAGNIGDGMGVLRRAAGLEKDPENRFALNLRLAELYLKETNDEEHAIECYNVALDIHPERDDLFAEIESRLMAKEDWDGLDQNYRFMIARLAADDHTRRISLWKKLGGLLADRAGNLNDAIKVFEVLLHLEPKDKSIRERTADLYTRSPAHHEKAVAMHHTLLSEDWHRTESYRALFKLYEAMGDNDRAFAYAQVMGVMGAGDSELDDYLSEHQIHPKQEATGKIERSAWGQYVLPAAARHNAGQILAILYHHMEELMPGSLKNEGLKKKDRLDPEDVGTFATTLGYLCETLEVQLPEIYLKPDFSPIIDPLAVQPATLIVDDKQFKGMEHREMLFLTARAAVLSRPDFLVGLLLPTPQVRALLDAAAQVYTPHFVAQGNPAEVANLRKRIERSVPRKLRDLLGNFCNEYMTFAHDFDIDGWRVAMLVAAHRAGLVLCHDLSVAVRMTKAHPGRLSPEQVEQLLHDLVNYSTSDGALTLRRQLGFSVR